MTKPSKYNINQTEVFQVVEKNEGAVVVKQVIEIQNNKIDQVGNLNTGDVTIHGNQIGIQNNTEPNPRFNLQ